MKYCSRIFLFMSFFVGTSLWAVTVDTPDVVLPTASGEVDLQDFHGKVVYLDFWASWCKPCQQSFPWMEKMQQAYKDQGLEIVAVNLDKDKKLADAFLKDKAISFTVAFDESGDSAKRFHLRGMPGSYLINRNGKLTASHIGFREKDKKTIETAIQKLLDQQD